MHKGSTEPSPPFSMQGLLSELRRQGHPKKKWHDSIAFVFLLSWGYTDQWYNISRNDILWEDLGEPFINSGEVLIDIDN